MLDRATPQGDTIEYVQDANPSPEAVESLFLLDQACLPQVVCAPDVSRGARLFEGARLGHFSLVSKLGGGGLGEVWLARDESLARDVVVKSLRPEIAASGAHQSKLLEEAHVSGQLEHPNIVPIYYAGKDDSGNPFYAMKYVNGRPLVDLIAELHGRGRPFSRRFELLEILGSFLDVCNAASFAHSKGIVHRDIKPSNILLGEHGQTLLVDWGLADRFTGGAPELCITEEGRANPGWTGSISGTPAYMPPEQAAGRLDLMDQRSDVYALGSVLYEILTGVPPYRGNVIAVINGVLDGPPSNPRELHPDAPRALEAICLKAMARSKVDRYQTVDDLATDVRRYLAGEVVMACEGHLYKLAVWLRRKSAAITVGLATLLVGAGGFGLSSFTAERESTAVDRLDGIQGSKARVEGMLNEARKAVRLGDFELAREEIYKAIGASEGTSGLEQQSRLASSFAGQLEIASDLSRALSGPALSTPAGLRALREKATELRLLIDECGESLLPRTAIDRFERGIAKRERVLSGSLARSW